MDYLDIYNIPETAIGEYDPIGGEVTPDLFDGSILRIETEGSFSLEQLMNQIDGLKFYLEVINSSGGQITMSFNNNYRATDLGLLAPVDMASGAIEYYEMICRIGLVIVYTQVGIPDDAGYLRNPSGQFILLNPKTGLPLINPEA